MHRVKFFKKFLMPCGLCAAAPALKPSLPPANCPTPCEADEKKNLSRPSELPIYNLKSTKEEACPTTTTTTPVNCEPSYIENGFGSIRKSIGGFVTQYKFLAEKVSDTVETGMAHSESLYDYLKEESNSAPRIGAIGIGALTGLIFSLRGGKFKKIIYTSTGGLIVAALCYPKQAEDGLEIAKHYANIGYNFAYGVKPGDADQLEISFPELPKLSIPKSFDGFIDQVVETGTSIASKASEYFSDGNQDKKSSKNADGIEDGGKPKQS